MKKLCKQWMKRVTALFLVAALMFSWYPAVTVAAATTAEEEDTSATDITAITRPATKGLILNYDQWANVNESLRLPTTVTVTLADGTTAEAAVTWDTTSLKYDTVGKYLLLGTVTLPEGATNGNNLKVYQVIKVEDFANILTNPSFESGSTSPWVKLSDSYATTAIVDADDAPDGTKVMEATYDGQMNPNSGIAEGRR